MIKAGDRDGELHGWPPAAPQCWARAFGELPDLDVDFGAPRPYLITRILARCLRPEPDGDSNAAPSDDDLWRWTVARRAQSLLAVVNASATATVTAIARCPRPECGQSVELELELASFARADGESVCTWRGAAGEGEIELRIPTGDDQRRWLASTPPDAASLPATMAISLVRSVDGAPPAPAWQLPPAAVDGVEHALAEHDPLTDLTVDSACPHCGGAFPIAIDVEALLLHRLAQTQQKLLLDVHSLASSYHWSEAEIAALPAWRRRYYLSAVRAEA